MAQQTHEFIYVTDGRGGSLRVGVRFNDQNLRVTGVNAVNASTLTAVVEVIYDSDGTTERFEIPPGFSGTRGFNRNLNMEHEIDPDTGEDNYGILGIRQWSAGFITG